MYSLKAAIARLVGWLIHLVKATAPRTHLAGLVSLEHTAQTGSPCFAVDTLHQPQSSPAQAALPKKQKAVQRTTAASKSTSKKQPAAQMAASLSNHGSSTATLALKTPRPVSQAQSQPNRAVLLTTAAQSSTQEQAPVQTHMASQHGEPGKRKAPAKQTRQPAKPARKRKR